MLLKVFAFISGCNSPLTICFFMELSIQCFIFLSNYMVSEDSFHVYLILCCLIRTCYIATQYKFNMYLLTEYFGESLGKKQWYLTDYLHRKYREVSLASKCRNYTIKNPGHIFHLLGSNGVLSVLTHLVLYVSAL